MNTMIEAVSSLLECCIFVRLCNGFLRFKSENKKRLKTVVLFFSLAPVDVFLCQLDGFDNYNDYAYHVYILHYFP